MTAPTRVSINAGIDEQMSVQQPSASNPFVGREREMAVLRAALAAAGTGRGRLVLLAGEPGIGKTRTAAEFATAARAAGACVLWGGCYDGEWAPPFGPFAEAISAYARQCDADRLRDDLGFGAAPIARVVSAVRERLPDLPDPAPLQPDEEQFRLFDSVSQFLIATAARLPVVLVLDDLQWADKGTVAMLRHVARFAAQHRILLLGTYRDVEIDAQHPLADVLGLYRGTSCDRIDLKGLEAPAVAQLVADSTVPEEMHEPFSAAIITVTNGNPFFVGELLHDLAEDGQLGGGGGPQSATDALARVGIPNSVRQVIHRRLQRLSAAMRRFLGVACGCGGPFHLGVVAHIAGLDEAGALNVLDEALRARLLRPADSAERYDFAHALIRETLYTELNPSRRARLHRQIAEAMEQVYGDGNGPHAAEIAQQYYRSKDLPGAERGVLPSLRAADRATAAAAHGTEAAFLRVALELLPDDDPRRARLLGRLALALTWALEFDAARETASVAGRRVADAEGPGAAADYLATVLTAMYEQGFLEGAFTLARQGLEYAGDRRDRTWASIKAVEIIHTETEGEDGTGIPLDTAERREVARAAGDRWTAPVLLRSFFSFSSRAELEATYPLGDARYRELQFGEYRRGIESHRHDAEHFEHQGRIAQALAHWAAVFRFHTALGEFARAAEARQHCAALLARLPGPSIGTAQFVGGEDEWRMARDEDWDKPMEPLGPGLGQGRILAWYQTSVSAAIARIHSRMGRTERALHRLAAVIPGLEKAPGSAENYTKIACDAAETLWLTARTDHIDIIERSVREKVVLPDFYYPMVDGRLAMARLCALQARCEEAVEWFAKARRVLDDQGARPLRAIVDYDEALMYVRRGQAGDAERAAPLLETALRQFRTLGMPGWIWRAEHLLHEGTEWTPAALPKDQPPSFDSAQDRPGPRLGKEGEPGREREDLPAPEQPTTGACIFRKEGDFWTVAYAGSVVRLKESKGLQYVAHLLRHAGQDVLALDLVHRSGAGVQGASPPDTPPTLSSAGAAPLLDAQAKAAYRRHLEELRDELTEAEGNNDLGRAERARAELEQIAAQLRKDIGLGGRDRRATSDLDRARSAVGKRIRAELKRIRAAHPALGRHLAATLTTGYFCSYRPDADLGVVWEL